MWSKDRTARNGEVIVALVEDGATVKPLFSKKKASFACSPRNDALDPIIVKEVQILGKVIGVFPFPFVIHKIIYS